MDVESLAKQLILQNMSPEQQNAVLESIKASLAQAKDLQKRKIGENVQVVVETLKKLEADIRARYDETGKAIEKRVASIKDGKDGKNGQDGRNGKDGRPGRDGAAGAKGQSGQDGANGVDGEDGISISDAHIDFDGSLIITLSDGKVLNVGEVVSQDIAEKINVISTMSTNGAVGIKDEGSSISTGVKNINFVGATVTATNSGDDVTVNVSAGTGTVTSVDLSGGTTGLTATGGPITTTGTITLGGTLAVVSGGTGTSTPSLVAGTNITSITGTWPNQTINASGSAGTVTSVAATVPAFLSVAGSPITTSGTLAISLSGTALPVANGGTGNATGTATINANLTGDVTSVGNASTLATVNSNVGAFTNANITVNAKGLITAAASGSPGGVTSVTGTSPVVSSGGTTPAISLAAGYGDTLNPYASKTANFVLAAPNGSAGVPTFRAVVAADIPTLNQNTTGTAANVTGTVAIANGGTGQTTAGAAFNALSPVTTTGDLIIGNGTNSATRLAIGANNYVLTSNGTTASWAAATGGVSQIVAGTNVTISPAGGTGAVTINASGGGSSAYARTTFTATAGQTAFTVTYAVGYLQIYVNGVLLTGSEYTATSGTGFTLATACTVGDIVEALVITTSVTGVTTGKAIAMAMIFGY